MKSSKNIYYFISTRLFSCFSPVRSPASPACCYTRNSYDNKKLNYFLSSFQSADEGTSTCMRQVFLVSSSREKYYEGNKTFGESKRNSSEDLSE